jgi:subtilisin-like proprotein convertase family protein
MRIPAMAAMVLAILTAPAAAQADAVLTDSDPISIPSLGPATPYPSTMEVSGQLGVVTDVQVALYGITHAEADQIDVLLEGPTGETSILMSDSCGDENLTGKIFFFHEISPIPLEEGNCVTAHGYKASDLEPGDPFPAPAPAGPYPANLGVFNGTRPNGSWRLFVLDDEAGEGGTISDGWLLHIAIEPDRCGGRAATIGGTAGPDLLRGTRGRDVIAGLGGDDVIRGLAGADLLCGGPGRDRLLGGAGRDRLRGGGGLDRLLGGPGRDRLFQR